MRSPRIQPDQLPCIVAVDPGKDGGVCQLWPDEQQLYKMPSTEVDRLELMSDVCAEAHLVIIEKVSEMPGQRGMFNFGMGYGTLRAVPLLAKIPLHEVTATKWQKEFVSPLPMPKKPDMSGMTKDETKEALRLHKNKLGQRQTKHKKRLLEAAQRLFPHHKLTLKTCDALLIAEYARRTVK